MPVRLNTVSDSKMIFFTHRRCTSGFTAEVSLLAAMLSSLAEARAGLAEREMRVDIKVLRQITYRFSQRARLT
jgi:hypothetical protein